MRAGNVEHISRLGKAGEAAAQFAHQRLAVGDRGAEMRGARREIAVMQIIGLDPRLDESAHQGGERIDVVVDAFEQHALADHRNSPIDQPFASRARLKRQFPGVIGVQRDIDGLVVPAGQRLGHRIGDALGRGDGQARVPAQDFHMRDRGERLRRLREPARRQGERIAPRQHHFPNFFMRADIIQRRLEFRLA